MELEGNEDIPSKVTSVFRALPHLPSYWPAVTGPAVVSWGAHRETADKSRVENTRRHQRKRAQDQLAAFDEMVSQRGSVPDIGPISIMINVPELARRGEHFRAYIRGDESSLPLNVRELAMILTAREMDCQFIWNAHRAFARQAGLSDELVNNLRDKKNLPTLSAEEAAVVDYGRELFRTKKVSPPVYDTALALFGVRGLVELINLLGYYSFLAFNINAFDVGLPDNITESPLPV